MEIDPTKAEIGQTASATTAEQPKISSAPSAAYSRTPPPPPPLRTLEGNVDHLKWPDDTVCIPGVFVLSNRLFLNRCPSNPI